MDRAHFNDIACEDGYAETTAHLQSKIAALATTTDRGPVSSSYVIGAFYAIVQLVWSQRHPDLSAIQFLAILQRHAADAIEPETLIPGGPGVPEVVLISGRVYRRFIRYPEPVEDGTVRCITCGQIDEPPHHDAEICKAASERKP